MGLDQKIFAERLRLVRKASGLTGAALAEMIGVKRQAIVNLETGRRSPSSDTLYDLAKAMGVSVDYLLGLPGSGPPSLLADLMPDLESLPPAGREAVRALVKGFRR